MDTKNMMKFASVFSVIAAVAMFAYLVHASDMFSYLSEDPKVCINCHTMNTEYATWQHSSHRERATCVECHLPQGSLIKKIVAKSRDGFKHSTAMTFRTYQTHNIRISEDARRRVQANCIACHREMVSEIIAKNDLYRTAVKGKEIGRICWDCHREVPHGTVRSLTTTPDNLGVKEI